MRVPPRPAHKLDYSKVLRMCTLFGKTATKQTEWRGVETNIKQKLNGGRKQKVLLNVTNFFMAAISDDNITEEQ